MCESALARNIQRQLKEWFPEICLRKRHGSATGIAGDPDLYAMLHGVHLEMEVKVGDNIPTPLQVKRMEEWKKAGAHVNVVYSLEDLRYWLERLTDRGILPQPAKAYRRVRASRA